LETHHDEKNPAVEVLQEDLKFKLARLKESCAQFEFHSNEMNKLNEVIADLEKNIGALHKAIYLIQAKGNDNDDGDAKS
jgi:hypothetical protein